MKIDAKKYAQALYQSLAGKKNAEVKQEIKNFVSILVKNNQLNKAGKIIEEFTNIWNKEEGIVEAEVVSAKALDVKTAKAVTQYIADLTKAKKINLKQAVDQGILGGVIVKYGDRILDGSLKTQILDLKEKLIK